MKRIGSKTQCALALAIAGILAIGPAMADKPSWAGGGKADRNERAGKGEDRGAERRDAREGSSRDDRSDERGDAGGSTRRGIARHERFDERHRQSVREYYSEQYRTGHCPPGLAKKENGCMPPGLAKKWQMGQPLPRDVIFHDLPQRLVTQLGQPPSRYRYVRIDSDILLIARSTGAVADAIVGLGGG